MSGRLKAIGIRIASAAHENGMLWIASDEGEVHLSPRGSYICWSPGKGIEIWVNRGHGEDYLGYRPHFSGSSRMRLRIAALHPDAKYIMNGVVEAWANPGAETPAPGAYPLLLDVPDFDLVRDNLQAGSVVTAQVAAFARDLSCYPKGEALAAAQGGEAGSAAESCIPTGMLEPGNSAPAQPQALARLSGRVEAARLVTNPASRLRFHHLLVRTPGGPFDVVAAPEMVQGTPTEGGVVAGSFWLSGRIRRHQTERFFAPSTTTGRGTAGTRGIYGLMRSAPGRRCGGRPPAC